MFSIVTFEIQTWRFLAFLRYYLTWTLKKGVRAEPELDNITSLCLMSGLPLPLGWSHFSSLSLSRLMFTIYREFAFVLRKMLSLDRKNLAFWQLECWVTNVEPRTWDSDRLINIEGSFVSSSGAGLGNNNNNNVYFHLGWKNLGHLIETFWYLATLLLKLRDTRLFSF